MTRPPQHGTHFYQDREFVNRERYELDVDVCRRIGKVYRPTDCKTVLVCPTFCPQLVIHESVDKKSDGLVLTHTITGACVARNLPDERAGQMLAGALAFLFRWSATSRGRLREQLHELDPKLQAWIRSLNTAEIMESDECEN